MSYPINAQSQKDYPNALQAFSASSSIPINEKPSGAKWKKLSTNSPLAGPTQQAIESRILPPHPQIPHSPERLRNFHPSYQSPPPPPPPYFAPLAPQAYTPFSENQGATKSYHFPYCSIPFHGFQGGYFQHLPSPHPSFEPWRGGFVQQRHPQSVYFPPFVYPQPPYHSPLFYNYQSPNVSSLPHCLSSSPPILQLPDNEEVNPVQEINGQEEMIDPVDLELEDLPRQLRESLFALLSE